MAGIKKSITIILPPELEEQLYDLRGLDPYKRLSMGEIIRRLIIKGLPAGDCRQQEREP